MAKRTRHADPSPSTDELYRAIPFAEVAKELLPLGAALGLPTDTPKASAKIAELAWVDARLAAVPGVALGLLEILVEAGGASAVELLATEARRRFGLEQDEVVGLLHALGEQLLLVPLTVRTHPYHPPALEIALFREQATRIAARVSGISLPAPPPLDETDASASPDSSLRDRIALLATSAHVALRVNKNATVNMSSCKKLAPMLGRPEQEVAREIDEAIADGLLGVQGTLLAPRVDVLRALAAGARAWAPTSISSVVATWVPEDRWVAREAVVRALVAHWSESLLDEEIDVFALRRRAEATLAQVVLATRTHEGHGFVRRAPSGTLRGSGDGHVTPSFEVMLGPAADPELTLVIALAAEPVRFDRVLTRRLTPASVSAALALGVSAQEIEHALEQVGRHGVPENVRAMVADWAKSARTATVRQVAMIETSSAEAADAAARALGSKIVARPTPTLLLVDGTPATLESALVKVGVRVTSEVASLSRATLAHVPQLQPPAWMLAQPPAELRARVQDRSALEAVRDLSPARTLRLAARDHVGPASRFLELAAKLWAAAAPDMAAWLDTLPDEERHEAMQLARAAPLEFVPWIIRTPRERKRMLDKAKSIDALLDAMHRAPPPHASLTHEGRDLLRQLGSREVLAALGDAAAETPTTEKEDTKVSEPPPLAPGQRPRAQDLAVQDRAMLRRAIDEAIASQRPLWVRVASKTQGERVIALTPERVLTRGNETTLLATDVESGDGRSFPLSNVLAVRPRT